MKATSTAPSQEYVEETVCGVTVIDLRRRLAFEEEALPYLDAVYRLALRMSADPILAEDLAQETMLRAFRSWEQYKAGTNVRAWLFTILRNTLISEYRNRRRQVESVDVSDVEGHTVFADVQEVDPAGRFFDQLVDEEVAAAVYSLPDDFKEAVVLSDVEGMSYHEISEVIGVPIGTVKSRLHRARQALQSSLYDYAVEMGYVASVMTRVN